MAATITVEEVMAFISTSLPDDVIQAFIDTVDEADSCLDGAGVSDSVSAVMKKYAVAHMIELSSRGDVKSQGSPSGASRSFKDGVGLGETNYGKTLKTFPSYGCLDYIINPDNKIAVFSIRGLS